MKSIKKKKRLITHNVKNKKNTIKLKLRKKVHKKRTTLKNIHTRKQIGGDTPMSKIIKNINFFKEKDRENYKDIDDYLNPVYGAIMCESGYIENNYYLAAKHKLEMKSLDGLSDEMKLIYNISNVVHPNVKPTKDIIQYLKPYAYGRLVAILYFYTKLTSENIQAVYTVFKEVPSKTDKPSKLAHIIYKMLRADFTKEMNIKATSLLEVERVEGVEEKMSVTALAKTVKFHDLFRKYLNVIDEPKEGKEIVPPSKEIFHILLYCLWWVSADIDGIRDYYRGINETFTKINKKLSSLFFPIFPIVEIKEIKEEMNDDAPPTFESIVGELVSNHKVINYEYALHFDKTSKHPTYPDCVETTARNFINLLMDNDGKFNIRDKKFRGINSKTIEYYTVFKSVDLQLSHERQTIYGQELNARDAWSYLIIYHANKNLTFKNKGYNVISGVMSIDGKKTNFIQLLQNLLSPDIVKADTLKEDLLELNPQISLVDDHDHYDAFKDGIGKVEITYDTDYMFTFDFDALHSCVSIYKKDESKEIEVGEEFKENKYIVYLLGEKESIKDENYLWFKYTSDSLKTLYEQTKDNKYLNLLTTGLSNPDARGRVTIDTNNLKDILINVKEFEKVANDFTYSSDDFEFVKTMPFLTSLNHVFKNKKIKELPDLSPLKQLKSIGVGFASRCENIETIVLEKLPNLESIGGYFANICNNLKSVQLIGLNKLETIGVLFAGNCNNLETVVLEDLHSLKTITNGFATRCKMLQTIILKNIPKSLDIDSIQHPGKVQVF